MRRRGLGVGREWRAAKFAINQCDYWSLHSFFIGRLEDKRISYDSTSKLSTDPGRTYRRCLAAQWMESANRFQDPYVHGTHKANASNGCNCLHLSIRTACQSCKASSWCLPVEDHFSDRSYTATSWPDADPRQFPPSFSTVAESVSQSPRSRLDSACNCQPSAHRRRSLLSNFPKTIRTVLCRGREPWFQSLSWMTRFHMGVVWDLQRLQLGGQCLLSVAKLDWSRGWW